MLRGRFSIQLPGFHFDFMGNRWASLITRCLADMVGGKMRKMGLETIRLFQGRLLPVP
jgi:hypothetical protein